MANITAREDLIEILPDSRSSWSWVNKSVIVVGITVVAALTVAARIYEQIYAWKAGLDATAPEFQTYWMHMLYAIFVFEIILLRDCGDTCGSPAKDLDRLSPGKNYAGSGSHYR